MGVLLCLNLPTIQEAEYNPAVMVDCDNINHLKPKPRIKDCQFTGLALNPLHVGFDSLCLIQPFFQVLFRGLDLGNDVIVACSQGAALNLMGLNAGPMRLPLCEMTPEHTAAMTNRLKEAGLL